jgi:phosphoglycolate phosphatase
MSQAMLRLIDCIEAVAFDLDGTLIDTVPDLAAAANMMLAILGGRPLAESRIPALVGAGIAVFVNRVLTESRGRVVRDPGLQIAATTLFAGLYEQRLFERSRVYDGVMETLPELGQAAIPSCCVTNKASRFALPLLEAAALREHLTLTLCADRSQDRKPSPNLLLAACARLGIQPAQLLYVGDAPSDIVAARAAGCRVVSVNYGYSPQHALLEQRPDGVVGNLMEIITLGTSGSGMRTLRAVS